MAEHDVVVRPVRMVTTNTTMATSYTEQGTRLPKLRAFVDRTKIGDPRMTQIQVWPRIDLRPGPNQLMERGTRGVTRAPVGVSSVLTGPGSGNRPFAIEIMTEGPMRRCVGPSVVFDGTRERCVVLRFRSESVRLSNRRQTRLGAPMGRIVRCGGVTI